MTNAPKPHRQKRHQHPLDNGLMVVTLFFKLVADTGTELWHGIKYKSMPLGGLSLLGAGICSVFIFNLSGDLFKPLSRFGFEAPASYPGYQIWVLTLAASPFWGWAFARVLSRRKELRRLQSVFITSGLKNALNMTPALVRDHAVDASTRVLTLTRAHLPKEAFEKAVPAMESALKIYVDEVSENRLKGTVDILYAHKPMPALVPWQRAALPRDTFLVGCTRSHEKHAHLNSVPHLLIAGQTGGGKSTFARQLIASLYLNNPEYRFLLVDLKGGLEFQIFAKLPRVTVVSQTPVIIARLESIDRELSSRFEILKANGAKDLDAYKKIPPNELKVVGVMEKGAQNFDRLIIVIDEIAELFLASVHEKQQKVGEAKAVLSRVARLGRAVGIHLIAGTQRPDAKVVDTQIKANLTGKICFQMSDIHSSMVVLGNARAKYLPPISGRAIWQSGMEQIEVQVPYLSSEETETLLREKRTSE